MQPTLHTPRLTLILLSTTTPDSQNLQWYHSTWSDVSATSWSVHGPSHSLSQSRARMISQLRRTNTSFYAVFRTPGKNEEALQYEGDTPLGELLGSVSLRRQARGPTLPPCLPGTPAQQAVVDVRVLGYAFFARARGRGYATEAVSGMLEAYSAFVAAEKAEGAEDVLCGGVC